MININKNFTAAVLAAVCTFTLTTGAWAEEMTEEVFDVTTTAVTEEEPPVVTTIAETEPVPEETTVVTEEEPLPSETTAVTEEEPLPSETTTVAEEEPLPDVTNVTEETTAAEDDKLSFGSEDAEEFDNAAVVSDDIEDLIINVTLPSSVNVVINPYRLNVNNSYDSVVSPVYTVTNESECAVEIVATVYAAPTGNTVISPAPLTGAETDKAVFLYLESAYGGTTFAESYSAAENQLAIGTSSASKKIMTLESGWVISQEGQFRITGDTASQPASPWTADDGVELIMSFKVEPITD